eukprot:TRINITY_DN364_c0_g2_i6.p4 TRINITY_DN364_c0_g2~~TRINITY_DN364_c0_g2_i6.p4  ORF type:complete len:103 (-),score=26.60 TRINITY_DN364_c0_g2_i6:733-1041(-)
MSRSILIVFLFALLQLVAAGRFFGGVAIADTSAFAKTKGKGKKGKGGSAAFATGTGIAIGPNAKAISGSKAFAGQDFAKASSFAAASTSTGKKGGKKNKKGY